MPAKSRPTKSTGSPGWLHRGMLLLLPFVLICAILGGVIWTGHWGLEQLRGRERYDVPFLDIDCEPPAGMKKQEFLDEVRYLSKPRLPQRLHLLNEDLATQLEEAFAQHPWVEKVTAVQIKPPKQIVVKLTYRTPVLAVKVGGEVRAVDGDGVLLPADAPTRELPSYDGTAKAPRGPAGTRWGDPDVEAAARKLKK